METTQKQSLLLTHGTIYGYTADSLPFHVYDALSKSVVKRADQVEWHSTLYPELQIADVLDGMLTNTAPIDFYHWNIAGDVGESGLELWQQCMTLFMRHI